MHRKHTILGWTAVFIGVLAWCLTIVGFSSWWQETRPHTVPEGSEWVAWDLKFTSIQAWTTSSLDVSWTSLEPMDGAIFVIVVLDFSLSSKTEYICSFVLLGEGRSWESSYLGGYHRQIDPSPSTGCGATDEDGTLLTSGRIATDFEIPQSAVSEIHSVRVTVYDPRNLGDIQSSFDYPDMVADMSFSLQ